MANHAALHSARTAPARGRNGSSPTSLEDRAKERAQERFREGRESEKALIERVSNMVIRDRLALPAHAQFTIDGGDNSVVRIQYAKDSTLYAIHPHALGQLATKAGLPLPFAHQLHASEETWRKELLCTNLNQLFQQQSFVDRRGEPIRFLHRTVGAELRGFVSRKFKRHLASAPLLRAFVEACRECFAQPVEASISDVRFSLKCFLPDVFEAFPGQYLCVGTEWSNSDFGVGKMRVLQTVWDPLRNTRTVLDLDHSVSKVHIGSIIEESDIEMSDATAAKEIDAQASAIRDSVHAQLETDTIERLLVAIRMANEQEIPWAKLRTQLATFLGRKDVKTVEEWLSSDIIELPPPGRGTNGEPIPTKWWASSVVSLFANQTNDEDRKLELQREAGRLLAGMMKGDLS